MSERGSSVPTEGPIKTRKTEWGNLSGERRKELTDRTKGFGLEIIKLVSSMPAGQVGRVISDQVLRSGTSVGANYRAACRARSKAEFISKLGIVEEELDETQYWLEVSVEAGLLPSAHVRDLLIEADELLGIVVASIRTARRSGQRIPQSAIRTPQPAFRNPQSP